MMTSTTSERPFMMTSNTSQRPFIMTSNTSHRPLMMTPNTSQQPFMMMSNTSQRHFVENQTSSFLETSTDFENFIYLNHSGNGTETSNNHRSRLDSFGIYEYGYYSSLLFVIVMGLVGNILLFIMMRDKKLNSLSYSVYLKCFAVSDSMVLIVTIIRGTQYMFSLQRVQLINNVLCKMFYSTRFLVMLLSPWLVVGLTLDRYVCICFPMTRNKLCTKKKAITICLSMLILSVLLTMPFVVTLELVDDVCRPDPIKYYFIVFRLILSSTLPCAVILVLNILMVGQIKRSNKFRNMFTRSTTDSTNRQQDSATRPMMLISVLALVTLLPVVVSEAVIIYIDTFTLDVISRTRTKKIWRILFIIYNLNFGQNFYILILSSSTYRNIIKRMFRCCSFRWNTRNQGNRPTLTTNRRHIAALVYTVPLTSTSPSNTSPALACVEFQDTALNIVV